MTTMLANIQVPIGEALSRLPCGLYTIDLIEVALSPIAAVPCHGG